MNMPLRWTLSIVLSLSDFSVCWWALQRYGHFDPGVAVGVAAVPFTITLTLGGVWADRARKREQSAIPNRITVRASHATDSQISGSMTGANFGPGGDFRNSNIFVGSQDDPTTFRSYQEEQPRGAPNRVVFGDIPQKPQSFEERSELQAKFTNAHSRQGVIFVLIGARGAGKSQLAGAIARRRLTDGWRIVAWVSAENTDQLIAELGQLAIELGLRNQDRDAAKQAMRVRHRLESDGDRCLLVLDNAINPGVIRQFLPAAGKAEVIITSSRRTLASLGTPLTVDVFTPAQSVAFLINRTGRIDEVGAREVADDLGYLPLALAQAAAVIAGQNIDYAKYRERLAGTRITDYLNQVEGDLYSLGVAEAIMLSISATEARDSGQVCRQVLELISALSPFSVSREYIYDAAQLNNSQPITVSSKDSELVTLFPATNYIPIGSPTAVDAALQVLTDYSLVTWNIDNHSVSVHRLVARVVRERADHDHTLDDAIQRAIGALYSMWSGPDADKSTFAKIDNEEAISHIAALENASFRDRFDDKHRIMLWILMAFRAGYEHATPRRLAALELADQGRLDEAIAALEAFLEELRPAVGWEHGDRKKLMGQRLQEDLDRLRQRRLE